MDPKLQSLLSELESGLGSVIRKREHSSSNARGDVDDSLSSMFFIIFYYREGNSLIYFFENVLISPLVVICLSF